MHMEYKRNIYLFLVFDFLTNLSPLSFIYALFLKPVFRGLHHECLEAILRKS